MSNKDFLKEICIIGANKKNIDLSNEKYSNRLNMELNVICDNDLEDFFLNTSFIINSFKDMGIFVGSSRGSAGGCLVSFLLNITTVNPLLYDLSFTRFLNEGRVRNGALPDIDFDVQKSRREEGIEFIKNSFGIDKVFGVTNFNKYSLKVAIKDISRVFSIDFNKVNNITKQITDDTTLDNIEENPIIKTFFEEHPQVKEYLPIIYGLNKTHGRHAGAVMLFPESIENYMSTNKIKENICTCYDKKIEDLGFIKEDCLGLETLDVISDTLSLINIELPEPEDFNDIKVFETINKSPLGIFQLEKQAGVKYLSETKIDTFEDLYNALALIRPGSRDTGDTDRYIERKKDPTKIEYDHPDLELILGDTLGVIIYQEQQTKIVEKFGNFDEVKADDTRKAIGKKKLDLLSSLKDDFISGGLSLGYDSEVLELLWSKIEAAGNYSFNKSHAVGYAFISYYCGWLKTYYPAEFLISVANHSNDEERVKVFNEIKNLDIKVLNPSVNKSEIDITMSIDRVVLGLRQIDGIGDKAIESIISKRPYISFDDFMMKRTPRQVNAKVVKSLIEAGAFDEFGDKRDDLYYRISDEEFHEWSTQEKLLREYKKLKLSPSQNLIDYYKDEINGVKVYSLDKLPKEDMDEFYIQGLVNSFIVKDTFNVLEISDGKDTASLFVDDIVKSKYFSVLQSVGLPLLIKCSQYNNNLGLSFLIDLTNKEDYQKQLHYINGDFNFDKGYVIKKLRYFKSKKKGTPCVRLDVTGKNGDEGLISCVSGYNRKIPNMEAGDMISFKRSGDTFINDIKLV